MLDGEEEHDQVHLLAAHSIEIGQVLALTAVLIGITFWRTRPSFTRHAFMTNSVLMIGGFILTAQQLFGYVFYP